MQLHKEAFQCGTELYVNIFYCSLRYTVSLSFHFKILDSISSKLKPFVSGTVRTMNKTAKNAIAAKRRKMFSAPSNSCRIEPANQIEVSWTMLKPSLIEKWINTFNGENAKVTIAFEPKLVRTARLMPLPLVRSGKISDTINQLIGPNDIWNSI